MATFDLAAARRLIREGPPPLAMPSRPEGFDDALAVLSENERAAVLAREAQLVDEFESITNPPPLVIPGVEPSTVLETYRRAAEYQQRLEAATSVEERAGVLRELTGE